MVTCQAGVRSALANPGRWPTSRTGSTLARHLELAGPGIYKRPVRYVLLVLVGAFLVLGLLNVFGQRPSTTSPRRARRPTSSSTRRLACAAGCSTRRGSRSRPHERLKHAVLQLALRVGREPADQHDRAEPDRGDEPRRRPRVRRSARCRRARSYVLFIEFQVNPTNVGRRRAGRRALRRRRAAAEHRPHDHGLSPRWTSSSARSSSSSSSTC